MRTRPWRDIKRKPPVCKDHPDYKAIYPPRVECKVCWKIWYAKQMKEGKPWWEQEETV